MLGAGRMPPVRGPLGAVCGSATTMGAAGSTPLVRGGAVMPTVCCGVGAGAGWAVGVGAAACCELVSGTTVSGLNGLIAGTAASGASGLMPAGATCTGLVSGVTPGAGELALF